VCRDRLENGLARLAVLASATSPRRRTPGHLATGFVIRRRRGSTRSIDNTLPCDKASLLRSSPRASTVRRGCLSKGRRCRRYTRDGGAVAHHDHRSTVYGPTIASTREKVWAALTGRRTNSPPVLLLRPQRRVGLADGSPWMCASPRRHRRRRQRCVRQFAPASLLLSWVVAGWTCRKRS